MAVGESSTNRMLTNCISLVCNVLLFKNTVLFAHSIKLATLCPFFKFILFQTFIKSNLFWPPKTNCENNWKHINYLKLLLGILTMRNNFYLIIIFRIMKHYTIKSHQILFLLTFNYITFVLYSVFLCCLENHSL